MKIYNPPNLSIIIPVFNAEKYLSNCLKSILNQTYNNFEIIIINDGSTDKSLEICKEFSDQDSRIKLINNQNNGPSIARNIGLRNAKGKYVSFIDSDDYVKKTYFEKLLKNIPDKKILIVSSYIKKYNKIETIQPIVNKIFEGDLLVNDAIINGLLTFSEPHCKIFSNDIIQKYSITFPDQVKIGEDGIFIAKYLIHVDYIEFKSLNEYIYQHTPTSIQRKLYSPEEEHLFFFTWKSELENLFRKLNFKKEEYLWEMVSVPYNRYLKSIINSTTLSFYQKIKKLNRENIEYTSKYGMGREYKTSGSIFKLLINHRLFISLIILSKLK